jgi:hypothetical protein
VLGWIICRQISKARRWLTSYQTIVELDLEELAAVDPPRGYGRD